LVGEEMDQACGERFDVVNLRVKDWLANYKKRRVFMKHEVKL
jgi:hypothetical protein